MTPRTDPTETGFAALGLDARLVTALTDLGYEEPTPIQEAAIPPLLGGRDVLAQAATGTGKTAAFALPVLDSLAQTPSPKHATAALILVPTRELAMQVAEAMHKYARGLKLTVLPIYGGAPMTVQLRALSRGADVVVATPGRALDHLRRGTLVLDQVRTVVLDEADEMLDMGFAEDLEAILSTAPAGRQTALFSATVAPRIAQIAARQLTDPVHVKIDRPVQTAENPGRVRQVAYIVPRMQKLAALGRVLDVEQPTSAMIFCRTRTEVDELTESMNGRGYRAQALHGGLSQQQRDRVMKRFRANEVDLLVATDVAARGLDVEHVSHVVNYDVPTSPEAYVHRIGRTGRAGRTGVAITLAEPREHRYLRTIEQVTKLRIETAQVPTVADLRARRLELTRAGLREALLAGDLDDVRVVVESLAEEFDLMDIAAAAVKLLEAEQSGPGDDVEIVAPRPRERSARDDRGSRDDGEGRRAPRHGFDRTVSRGGDAGEERPARPARRAPAREQSWEAARLYIGAGRQANIRPGDLVGAIANEAQVDASAVGAIEIQERFSIVEVPAEIAEDIIEALRSTTIKGKRVIVRRDRDGEGGGGDAFERPRRAPAPRGKPKRRFD
ncbi:MAG: DEAD/DEAH box helicase [Gemmatimonadaceae bacterium]|nr:DEAD/DEAH box helicase [Gemmatimonadaceae bacterium]